MNTRQQKLLEMLQQNGRVNLHEAAQIFAVSEMTLRRDFRELEEKKLLVPVKNGAIPYPVQYAPEPPPEEPGDLKLLLAKMLYRRIIPCRTLFIGTGSSCLAFARTVARGSQLPETVITHSLSVASAFFRSSTRVILLGGELRTGSMDLVGPVAEKNLEEYQVDYLVTGCDGASADFGFYTSDVRLSNLEKKMISIAHRMAVITESTKFRCRSLTRFATPDDVDLLVTDGDLAPESVRKLAAKQVEILLVQGT